MNNNVLIVVGGIIIIVVGFLIYGAMDDEVVVVPITSTSTAVTGSSSATSAQVEAQLKKDAADRAEAEAKAKAKEVAFTVDVSKLPEAQQASLKLMGMNETSIDITNAMVTCAKVDMSATRVTEIKDGASVTASEGIKLVSCYNANN